MGGQDEPLHPQDERDRHRGGTHRRDRDTAAGRDHELDQSGNEPNRDQGDDLQDRFCFLRHWEEDEPPGGRVKFGGGAQRYRVKSSVPFGRNAIPSPSRRARWRPGGMSGSRSVDVPPEALTTRCQGMRGGQPCIAHPTARGDTRLSTSVASWP